MKPLWIAAMLVVMGPMMSLGVTTVWAVGGIALDEQSPHFAKGNNRSDFDDMRVKVLGGYVHMSRRWIGDKWEWNSRWNDLEVNYYKPWLPEYSGPLSDWAEEYRYYKNHIIRNNQLYILSRETREKQITTLIQAYPDDLVYENGLYRTLTQDKDDYDWLWEDRKGNKIHYNKYGQMTHYWDRNGVTVSVDRNNAGNIIRVRDHHNTVVVTLTWENIPGSATIKNTVGDDVYPQRPTQLQDYTGRTVTYTWGTQGDLESVTDVRGEVWTYQYNGGNLTSQTDPEGRVTAFSIDGNGIVRSRTNADGAGRQYNYSYDQSKKQYYIASTDGSGRVVETWYNNHGMPERQDLNGETQYTAEIVLSNNSLGTEDFVGRYKAPVASSSSSSGGGGSGGPTLAMPVIDLDPIYVKTQTVTDARGNKTRYQYDQWRNILSITQPDGSQITATYDLDYSLPRTVTDERGVVTEYRYDDHGNVLTLIEARGTADQRITRYTYDGAGQVLTMTTGESSAGNTALATTTYAYDAYGNVTHIIDPVTRETVFENYDALGNAATITDARDNVWQYTYDAAGNLLTERNPLNQGTTYTYNRAGDIATITEANGAVTTVATNASGLPTEITDASAQTTRLEFDKGNRLTGLIDANGNGRYLSYDEQGRLKTFTDAADNVTRFDYKDTLLERIQYPTFSESFGYDRRNRVTSSTQQANNRTYLRRFGYDVTDNVTGSIDANNLNESYQYDALNRLTAYTDANSGITRFDYDARDNLIRVTDPENRITEYTYTLRDALATETKQDYLGTSNQFRYTYDANGNLESSRTPQNEVTVYTYDEADRLSQTELFAQQGDALPIKRVTYSYNSFDQYTGYSQVLGTGENVTPTADILPLAESYTYNILNQLESVTVHFGGFQKTYSYTYYPNGLKKTYTNPEGITYTYYYTKHDQLAAVVIPSEGQIGLTDYFWQVPQTILLPGGSQVTLTYDQFLQVNERLLEDPADTELARALYQYDLENNITQIGENFGTLHFQYDNLYRLTDVDYPWTTTQAPTLASDEGFTYDGVGNRITEGPGEASPLTEEQKTAATTTLSYDNHNRLSTKTGATPASFSYNANGHTVQKISGGTTTDYIYNKEERLIEVQQNGATVGQYSYNPYGQRIRKVANGQTTWFLYNDEGLAAEYDNSGNLIKEYHFTPYAPWMTAPLFQRTQNGSVYYYQNDHLGTPQRLVSKSGAVVWEARYAAFGEAEILTETVGNNLRMAGQYYDSETGLHHNYFRDYDPALGRYLQSDPIGVLRDYSDPQLQIAISMGMLEETDSAGEVLNHVYGYVGQNPLYWIDPFGLAEHTNNQRPSNREKHENANARRDRDRGGEKGDENRRDSRKKPKGWKGKWPRPTVFDFVPNPCLFNPYQPGCLPDDPPKDC